MPGGAADTPITAAGPIGYTLTARNVGNVTLTDVTITDGAITGVTCTPNQPATLAPGESIVCSGTRDIDGGFCAHRFMRRNQSGFMRCP